MSSTSIQSHRRRRNQRRSVYLASLLVPLLMGGFAFHWWYYAEFPMPKLSKSSKGIDLGGLENYLSQTNTDLRWWKSGREARRFSLAGTTWGDAHHGLILKFTDEGILELRPAKTPASIGGNPYYLSPFSKRPTFLPFADIQQITDAMNGRRYRFLSDAAWPAKQDWLTQSCPLNLEISDSD